MDQPSYIISVVFLITALSVLVLILTLRFLFPSASVPATRNTQIHNHRGIRITKSMPNLRLSIASSLKVATPIPRPQPSTSHIAQGQFPLAQTSDATLDATLDVEWFAASTNASAWNALRDRGPAQSPIFTPINSYFNSYKDILLEGRQMQAPKACSRCSIDLNILHVRLAELRIEGI